MTLYHGFLETGGTLLVPAGYIVAATTVGEKHATGIRRAIFPNTDQNEQAFKLLSDITKNSDLQDIYDVLVLEKPRRPAAPGTAPAAPGTGM